MKLKLEYYLYQTESTRNDAWSYELLPNLQLYLPSCEQTNVRQ